MTQATAGGMHHLSAASAVSAQSAGGVAASSTSSAAPPSAPKEQLKQSPQVEAYEQLIQGSLTNYINLSKELGGLIAEQVRTSNYLLIPLPLSRSFNSQSFYVITAGSTSSEWIHRPKGLHSTRFGLHQTSHFLSSVLDYYRSYSIRFDGCYRHEGEEPREQGNEPIDCC